MENNNQTIKSASNLTEIKNKITELKKIFSQDEKYKKQLENLIDAEKYIEELESKDEDEPYNLKTEDVMNDSIERLYEKIRKYELFYQLYNFSESLNQEMLYINENNIYDLTNKCVEMHTKLLNSDFKDYKEVEYLLPTIYECIYNGMKREIVFSDYYKELFYTIKKDDTKISHPYIAKLIENDIVETESEELLMQLKYLKAKGLDSSNIIDLDLLTSITKMTMKNIKIDSKENLLENIDSYEKMEDAINESEEKCSNAKSIVKKDEQEKREAFGSVVKILTIYGINVSLVFGIGVGAHLVEKNISRKYYTTTTTYKSETGEYNTSKPEYEIKKSNPIKITEEEPWKEDSFITKTYKKYIYTYNLSENEDYKDLSDYIDYLLENPRPASPNSLMVSEKPEEFGKEETVYIVEKKEYDENNYTDIDLKNHLFYPTMFLFLAGVIDLLILTRKYKYDSNNLKRRLNNHKTTKKNLINHKKLLQEKEKELKDIINQREKLYEEIISNYNKLPKIIQEDDQLKTSIQKLKK